VQRCDNLVDLDKSCKMSIYLQNLVPIQLRTSRLKFDDLAEKSEKASRSNLYTKASARVCARSPARRSSTRRRSPKEVRVFGRLEEVLRPCPRLILGCISADFGNQIFILLHFQNLQNDPTDFSFCVSKIS